MRFDAAMPPHTQQHTSNRFHVPYWVDPKEVKDYSKSQWKQLDKMAENRYVQVLTSECESEQTIRTRLAQEAQGFFWTDMEKLDRARQMDMPSCRKLQSLTGGRYQ